MNHLIIETVTFDGLNCKISVTYFQSNKNSIEKGGLKVVNGVAHLIGNIGNRNGC